MGTPNGIQSMLSPQGPYAREVAVLWWVMLAGAVVIFLITMGMLGTALVHRRSAPGERLSETSSRTIVLWSGLIIPLLVLFSLITYSVLVGRDQAPRRDEQGVVTLHIIGKRWWWSAEYRDAQGHVLAETANEFHIPAGQRVKVELSTRDVIHSFWVPNLRGKTDLIPGRTNVSWLLADRPGVFRGQCAEFCGAQHAHMGFEVVAEPPDAFWRWIDWQSQPAMPTVNAQAQHGQEVFLGGPCVMCHAIRGTSANAAVGPDLTHLGSRRKLAAALLPNTPGHLGGWIVNSQGIKPGSQMPRINLPSADLLSLIAYLEGLR